MEVQNFTNKTVIKYKDAKGVTKMISKSLRKNAKVASVMAALWATYELLPDETKQDLEREVMQTVQ